MRDCRDLAANTGSESVSNTERSVKGISTAGLIPENQPATRAGPRKPKLRVYAWPMAKPGGTNPV